MVFTPHSHPLYTPFTPHPHPSQYVRNGMAAVVAFSHATSSLALLAAMLRVSFLTLPQIGVFLLIVNLLTTVWLLLSQIAAVAGTVTAVIGRVASAISGVIAVVWAAVGNSTLCCQLRVCTSGLDAWQWVLARFEMGPSEIPPLDSATHIHPTHTRPCPQVDPILSPPRPTSPPHPLTSSAHLPTPAG